MSANDFHDWIHVPRAIVAVLVLLVVTGRFLTQPTSDPLVVVSTVAVAAFFVASSIDPVRTHRYYPTATAGSITVLFAFWTVVSDDPGFPGLLTVAAGGATLAAFYYAWVPSAPDDPDI